MEPKPVELHEVIEGCRIRRQPLLNVVGARLWCALTSPAGWHGRIVAASGDVVTLESGDVVRLGSGPRVVEWCHANGAAGVTGPELSAVDWVALGVPSVAGRRAEIAAMRPDCVVTA